MTTMQPKRDLGLTTGADATLRLIAGLPAPEGLEDRVKARLQNAPGNVLHWPLSGSWIQKTWARGAAAAAIVVVVAGGSWQVYSRVQPKQAQIAIPRVVGSGGFSSANAVRTPKTLDVPMVTQQAPKPGHAKKVVPGARSAAVQTKAKSDAR